MCQVFSKFINNLIIDLIYWFKGKLFKANDTQIVSEKKKKGYPTFITTFLFAFFFSLIFLKTHVCGKTRKRKKLHEKDIAQFEESHLKESLQQQQEVKTMQQTAASSISRSLCNISPPSSQHLPSISSSTASQYSQSTSNRHAYSTDGTEIRGVAASRPVYSPHETEITGATTGRNVYSPQIRDSETSRPDYNSSEIENRGSKTNTHAYDLDSMQNTGLTTGLAKLDTAFSAYMAQSNSGVGHYPYDISLNPAVIAAGVLGMGSSSKEGVGRMLPYPYHPASISSSNDVSDGVNRTGVAGSNFNLHSHQQKHGSVHQQHNSQPEHHPHQGNSFYWQH